MDPDKFPWLDLRRYTFSMAAEQAGIVFLSGQTAAAYYHDEAKVLCKGDLIEQTNLIYEKLAVVLEAAGLGFQHVVQTVDYVDAVALPQYRQTAEVRRKYFGDSPVASTGICVERLLRPDALIEISAVAMREEKRRIDPSPQQDSGLTFAPGVEAGGIVWVSGVIGREERDGRAHYPQNSGHQAALAYAAIGPVLQAAGARASDVVKNLDYISPLAVLGYGDAAQARRGFYDGSSPACDCVVVNRLLRPEGHLEVETVAVKGGSRQDVRLPQWRFREDEPGSLVDSPAAAIKGRLLCLSGQEAINHATGASVGGFDVAAQAEQAYSNISQVLAEAGYSMGDVVNTVEWVAPNGLMGYRGVQEVRRKHFGEDFPAATGVVAHRMFRPELLIHVSAMAVV